MARADADGVDPSPPRHEILTRKLPHRRPDRIWGGPSFGGDCAICDQPLRHGDLEIEMEFKRIAAGECDPARYRAHVPCFSGWASEISEAVNEEVSRAPEY